MGSNNRLRMRLRVSARNADLKAALVGSQPLFLRHLEHAQMVQAGAKQMMKGKKGK